MQKKRLLWIAAGAAFLIANYLALTAQGGFKPPSLPADSWTTPPATGPAGVSLSVVHTGENRGPEAFIRRSGSLFRMRSSLAPAILVTHPRGNLLIDAGLGRAHQNHVTGPGGIPVLVRPSFTFKKRTPAVVRLGTRAAQIQHIVLTHMHFDHAGGIEDFPGARIWVPEAEHTHQGARPATEATTTTHRSRA